MRATEVFVERARESATKRSARKPNRASGVAAYTVFIRDLRVETCVGAFRHERRKPTVLLMDIDIDVECRAGVSDMLCDAIDYGEVVIDLRQLLATKRYFLLERLSECVASRVLNKFGALKVRVSVAKLGIIEGVGRVGIVVDRCRPATRPRVSHAEELKTSDASKSPSGRKSRS